MKTKANQAYKVREPGIEDAIDVAGMLASGGLNPRVASAVKSDPGGAMLIAMASALSNPETRDQIKQFLYRIWISPVDHKLDIAKEGGNAEQVLKYEAERMAAWAGLPMEALPGLIKAFSQTKNFESFLESVKMFVPDLSGKASTESNGSTG